MVMTQKLDITAPKSFVLHVCIQTAENLDTN